MKKRVFRNVLGLALAAVMTVSAAMPALAARGPDTAYETLAESHVTQAKTQYYYHLNHHGHLHL